MCVGILWVVCISLRCGSDNGRCAFKEVWYGCWLFFPRLLKCIENLNIGRRARNI